MKQTGYIVLYIPGLPSILQGEVGTVRGSGYSPGKWVQSGEDGYSPGKMGTVQGRWVQSREYGYYMATHTNTTITKECLWYN